MLSETKKNNTTNTAYFTEYVLSVQSIITTRKKYIYYVH